MTIVRIYDTIYFNLQYQIILGDKNNANKYVKASRIIENEDNSLFCIPYLEDGRFKICLFTTSKLLYHDNVS